VLSYVIAISVFSSVTIAGLRFTVYGGGESRKKYQSIMPILQKNISNIKRAFSGNCKLATVNPISMLNNMPVLLSISRDSIKSES